MARYRKIDPRIWNDAKFSSLSSEAQLLFFYLLTCPQMTVIGAVPLRAEAVAIELRMDAKQYAIRYAELYREGMVEYDERGLFWVKNFLRYNAPDNPKVVLSWRDSLDYLPECPLLMKVVESCEKHCESRGIGYMEAYQNGIGSRIPNGMAYRMPYPMPYQEQEQEQEQDREKEKKKRKALDPKTEDLVWPDDVPEEIRKEFVAYRPKGKKHVVTQRVIDLNAKEAQKAGIPLADALTYAMGKEWVGFTASYYLNAEGRNNRPTPSQSNLPWQNPAEYDDIPY